MGYQALLFCPDEKTARTVTQVLSELEFNVEPCSEPFAAVKKLMGEHFDALVVDCDNEQNATLLFKSARTSTSNQASLAVAVVEGQAGVAKAFRIGANLVLTKPINVEQAKGTLRVARGLLRKGEPAKPPASPVTPATSASASAPSKPAPTSAVRPPVAPPPGTTPRPTPQAAKPAPIASPPQIAAVAADAASASRAEAIVETKVSEPARISAPAPPLAQSSKPLATPVFKTAAPATTSSASGAASAPAPARSAPAPAPAPEESAPLVVDIPEPVAEPSSDPVPESSSNFSAGSTPSFNFGSASTPADSSGGSKKIVIGIAAAVVIAAALYFGWTRLQSVSSQSAGGPKSDALAPVVNTQPAVGAQTTSLAPAPSNPAPTSLSSPSSSSKTAAQPTQTSTAPTTVADNTISPDDATDPSGSSVKTPTSAPLKGSAPKSSPAPLLVHGGAAHASKATSAAADAQAPSMIGIAASSSDGSLPNLGASGNAPTPVLQAMNVSQGVSQGLLIKKVQPSYPANALHLHVEGAVALLATISKSGDISAVKILSGDALLSKAAADAVKQWKYQPYLLNGEPVEIQTQITIHFKLPN
jgi:TonB family protein